MTHFLFNQLAFVRGQALKAAKDISEETSLIVPNRFNNNIKWNLGHIYLVQERFAFYFIGEEMVLPDSFHDWFGRGTKPADWQGEVPKTDELRALLEQQTERIERQVGHRMSESTAEPFVTSAGMKLSTVEEFLTFSLYHEGLHTETIKSIKRFL
ncbi:DinB family protein [Domibacillus sp. A3M-37]|uniref:DinB family protein n=1 Tax=Domibacillus sp. A3M-37 TaxID=2962037 RepID=UPI0020B8FFE7|nr:DinB family protein [Domibacillus sp. A3M-37]MCP3760881.1 DinB family protein [Domibacillus sp. A3M-37]